jgi:hypothetical protein
MMDQHSYMVLGILVLLIAGGIFYGQYLDDRRKKLVKTVESLGGKRYFSFGRYMSGFESNIPVKNAHCIETDDVFHFSTGDGKVFGKIDKTDVTSATATKTGKTMYSITIEVKGADPSNPAVFAFSNQKKADQGNKDIKQGLGTEMATVN